MNRKLVASDIHGNGATLIQLLNMASFSKHDRLYLLGDYVKKGPDSLGTIMLVKWLKEQMGTVVLRGNHEDKWLSNQYGNMYPKLTPEWQMFLQSLPYWYEDEEYLFVHAGIRFGTALEEQQVADLTAIREEFYTYQNPLPKTIVFGHTQTDVLGANEGQIWKKEGKIGIDTGAGQKKFLTLYDLTNRVSYRRPVLSLPHVENRS